MLSLFPNRHRSVLLILVAATFVAPAQEPSSKDASATGTSSGKALIYIYRDGNSRHAIYYGQIFINGEYLAALHRSNYAKREVVPGAVSFADNLRQKAIPTQLLQAELLKLKKTAKEKLSIDVEAGKTYYIKYSMHNTGSKMELVDEETGAKEMGAASMHPAGDAR